VVGPAAGASAAVGLAEGCVAATACKSRIALAYVFTTGSASAIPTSAGNCDRISGGRPGSTVSASSRFCHALSVDICLIAFGIWSAGPTSAARYAAHACTPAEGHGMNTGLQDAFNLGWKLALVCRGEAGAGLLDTYEAERRPVAQQVVSSGADVELAHAMTDPAERAARDAELRRMLADPDLLHHEAAAASELDRSYPRSRAVAGDDNELLAPGVLLPDTPQRLHELTHVPGHTLLVLGGPQADPARVRRLVTELDAAVGTTDDAVALQLGVSDVTILVVRPDRYIGLRDDSGDPRVVAEYLDGLTSR